MSSSFFFAGTSTLYKRVISRVSLFREGAREIAVFTSCAVYSIVNLQTARRSPIHYRENTWRECRARLSPARRGAARARDGIRFASFEAHFIALALVLSPCKPLRSSERIGDFYLAVAAFTANKHIARR